VEVGFCGRLGVSDGQLWPLLVKSAVKALPVDQPVRPRRCFEIVDVTLRSKPTFRTGLAVCSLAFRFLQVDVCASKKNYRSVVLGRSI